MMWRQSVYGFNNFFSWGAFVSWSISLKLHTICLLLFRPGQVRLYILHHIPYASIWRSFRTTHSCVVQHRIDPKVCLRYAWMYRLDSSPMAAPSSSSLSVSVVEKKLPKCWYWWYDSNVRKCVRNKSKTSAFKCVSSYLFLSLVSGLCVDVGAGVHLDVLTDDRVLLWPTFRIVHNNAAHRVVSSRARSLDDGKTQQRRQPSIHPSPTVERDTAIQHSKKHVHRFIENSRPIHTHTQLLIFGSAFQRWTAVRQASRSSSSCCGGAAWMALLHFRMRKTVRTLAIPLNLCLWCAWMLPLRISAQTNGHI